MPSYKSSAPGDIEVRVYNHEGERMHSYNPEWLKIPEDWLVMQLPGNIFYVNPTGNIEVRVHSRGEDG